MNPTHNMHLDGGSLGPDENQTKTYLIVLLLGFLFHLIHFLQNPGEAKGPAQILTACLIASVVAALVYTVAQEHLTLGSHTSYVLASLGGYFGGRLLELIVTYGTAKIRTASQDPTMPDLPKRGEDQ